MQDLFVLHAAAATTTTSAAATSGSEACTLATNSLHIGALR